MIEEDGTFLDDGQAWFAHAAETCARLNLDYLIPVDGAVWAGVPGKGEVSMDAILKAEGKKKTDEGSNVVGIKQ